MSKVQEFATSKEESQKLKIKVGVAGKLPEGAQGWLKYLKVEDGNLVAYIQPMVRKQKMTDEEKAKKDAVKNAIKEVRRAEKARASEKRKAELEDERKEKAKKRESEKKKRDSEKEKLAKEKIAKAEKRLAEKKKKLQEELAKLN